MRIRVLAAAFLFAGLCGSAAYAQLPERVTFQPATFGHASHYGYYNANAGGSGKMTYANTNFAQRGVYGARTYGPEPAKWVGYSQPDYRGRGFRQARGGCFYTPIIVDDCLCGSGGMIEATQLPPGNGKKTNGQLWPQTTDAVIILDENGNAVPKPTTTPSIETDKLPIVKPETTVAPSTKPSLPPPTVKPPTPEIVAPQPTPSLKTKPEPALDLTQPAPEVKKPDVKPVAPVLPPPTVKEPAPIEKKPVPAPAIIEEEDDIILEDDEEDPFGDLAPDSSSEEIIIEDDEDPFGAGLSDVPAPAPKAEKTPAPAPAPAPAPLTDEEDDDPFGADLGDVPAPAPAPEKKPAPAADEDDPFGVDTPSDDTLDDDFFGDTPAPAKEPAPAPSTDSDDDDFDPFAE